MPAITLNSPAKINLYLKIINKRDDGFHNIKTIFERISLCDEIKLKTTKSGKIRVFCQHPHVPTNQKNLVYKVAEILKKDFEISDGIDITIKKNIPVAAGLAGGSSNAATVLVGLNDLWNLKLNDANMLRYASKIGSDVSFFIHNTSWALGTGRGEKLKPLKLKKRQWYVLVTPRVKMHTWKVYQGLKLKNLAQSKMLTKSSDNATILIHKLYKDNILEASQYFENDLESVIVRLCPSLKIVKQKLKSLKAKGVTISGSGPSVFGLVESYSQAKEIQRELLKRYKQVFVVRTL